MLFGPVAEPKEAATTLRRRVHHLISSISAAFPPSAIPCARDKAQSALYCFHDLGQMATDG